MTEVREKKFRSIAWYKTPLDRELLKRLNQRSDSRGFVQSIGHLLLIAVTGTAAALVTPRRPLLGIPLLLIHGTCYAFMINAVHELGHGTVFRTRWLNGLFERVFAFLGWINFEHFHASHMRHHAFTLYPPDDLEVVLPMRVIVRHMFTYGIVNPMSIWRMPRGTFRNATGRFGGEWSKALFPDREKLRGPIRWARILLIGHGLIVAVSIHMHWWMLPIVTTFAPCYGSCIQSLLNNTQHIGLRDNVPDFRLCCRTILVNPVFQFLYWHMNYHIEHHMYPTVPCYHLAKLHRAMAHDLPHCPRGLVETWKQIGAILRKQEQDPAYQFEPELPRRPAA